MQGRATAERLNGFRNVGRLMGLCLLQNELCPMFLNRHVIKYLLGRRVRFHDLAFFDPVIYESLRQLVIDAESKVKETHNSPYFNISGKGLAHIESLLKGFSVAIEKLSALLCLIPRRQNAPEFNQVESSFPDAGMGR